MNENSASDGGAISPTHNSSLIAKETKFQNNRCSKDGGAIKAYLKCTLNITNSFYCMNKGTGSSGGAIFLGNDCNMTTKSSEFLQNSAVSGGGAIMVLDHSHYKDTGSLFQHNRASDVGKFNVINVEDAAPTVYFKYY